MRFCIEIDDLDERGVPRCIGFVGEPGGPGRVASTHRARKFSHREAADELADVRERFPGMRLVIVPAPPEVPPARRLTPAEILAWSD